MSWSKKAISFDLRQLVVFHHANGKSYIDISTLLKISWSAAGGSIVWRFKKEECIDYNNQNAGHPQKFIRVKSNSYYAK